jgi:hypothetical protein
VSIRLDLDVLTSRVWRRLGEIGVLVEPASYIVFTDGSKYYAKNGSTGMIEFTDTDFVNLMDSVMNALPAQGGKVFIKAGTYKVTRSVNSLILINSRSNVVIEGEGPGTFIDLGGLVGMGIYIRYSTNVVIANLRIEKGNPENIRLYGSSNVLIDGVWSGYAMVKNDGDGIDIDDSENIVIRGCFTYYNDARGIHPSGGAKKVVIQGCVSFNDMVQGGGGAIDALSASENVVIDGCIVINSGGGGFSLESNNNVLSNSIVVNATSGAIYVSGSNNRVVGCVAKDISIVGSDNIIESNTVNYIAVYGSGTQVIGNRVIGGVTSCGIYVKARALILGNRILGFTGSAQRGILLSSGSDNSLVMFNEVRNNTRGIEVVSGVSNVAILYNDVRDNIYANILDAGTGTIKRGNIGYPTENSGVATISAGSTRVTVSHGLASTPTKVLITPLGQPPGKLWVENITSTSFDIVTDTAPTSNLNVAWYAEV